MGLSLALTLAVASPFVRRRGPVLGFVLALAFLAFSEAEVVVRTFTFATLLALASVLLPIT